MEHVNYGALHALIYVDTCSKISAIKAWLVSEFILQNTLQKTNRWALAIEFNISTISLTTLPPVSSAVAAFVFPDTSKSPFTVGDQQILCIKEGTMKNTLTSNVFESGKWDWPHENDQTSRN